MRFCQENVHPSLDLPFPFLSIFSSERLKIISGNTAAVAAAVVIVFLKVYPACTLLLLLLLTLLRRVFVEQGSERLRLRRGQASSTHTFHSHIHTHTYTLPSSVYQSRAIMMLLLLPLLVYVDHR